MRTSARAASRFVDRAGRAVQPLLFKCEPQPDEHPASWLLRLSWANGFLNGATLVAMSDPAHPAPSAATLDTPIRRQGLATMTGYGDELLNRIGVTEVEAALGGLVDEYPMSRWRLRIPAAEGGKRHSKNQPIGVCVACLTSDEVPYWRRDWSLSVICRCPVHGKLLTDRCGACGARLVLSFYRRTDLLHCDVCGQDLNDGADLEPAPSGPTSSPPCPTQFMAVPGLAPPPVDVSHEHLFWDGLWWLLSHFCAGDRARKVAELKFVPAALRDRLLNIPARLASARVLPLPERPIAERETLLALAWWVIGDWPARAILVLGANQLTMSSFAVRVKDVSTSMPFWLARTIDEFLRMRPYRPNQDEVRAAAEYLIRQSGEPPSRIQLKRILGVAESEHVAQVVPINRERFTSAHATRLLTAMERMIARTPRARCERDAALRDCVIIALCLARSETVPAVTRLSISEIQGTLRNHSGAAGAWSRRLERLTRSWLVELGFTDVGSSTANEHAANTSTPHALKTRFRRPYLGNGVPARMVRLLREIGYGAPERGVGVVRDMRMNREALPASREAPGMRSLHQRRRHRGGISMRRSLSSS